MNLSTGLKVLQPLGGVLKEEAGLLPRVGSNEEVAVLLLLDAVDHRGKARVDTPSVGYVDSTDRRSTALAGVTPIRSTQSLFHRMGRA